jgi:hypothetical protein
MKKQYTTVLCLLALLFPFVTDTETYIVETSSETVVEDLPEKEIVDVPDILKKIAWCESRNRQFNDDGTVFRGKINPQDSGKFQINEHYHLKSSIALGFDIYTLEGNTAYAEYLYTKQGTTPWNWSKDCWGDPDRVWKNDGSVYWSF